MGSDRLDDLGWAQFQDLVDRLFAVDAGAWTGDADTGRLLRHDGSVAAVTGDDSCPPPVLVVCHWFRDGADAGLTERVRGAARDCASVLLVSNAPAAAAPGWASAVVGPERLTELIRASCELRLAMPSLLGVLGTDGFVDDEVRRRSTLAFAEAQRLAAVFVPTRAYAAALRALREHRFVVLTGPPEMGKTAAARMLGLARMSCGWEAHECLTPDALWAAFDRSRRQLFIADDAFGSTEYRPEAAERWARDLDRVLARLDDDHLLVWTSRPAPLKAGLRRLHRERGLERFPAPGEVQADASRLDLQEKVLMLFRHAKAAACPPDGVLLLRAHGATLVADEHFTPERIRRFVSDRLPVLLTRYVRGDPVDFEAIVRAELEEPTRAMAESFRALPAEHRDLLVAMLDAPAAPVHERDLAAALRRHRPVGLQRAPRDVVDRLADHFVRVLP